MANTDANELAKRCAEQMWSEDRASQHLGMQIDSVGEGVAVLSMTVNNSMVNGHKICHGGYIFTLADSAFAFACNSQNESAVAASAGIEFLRPAYEQDRLTASARCVHQGGRNGIYDVTVVNQDDKIIAHLRGRSARINKPVIPENA